MTNTLLIGFIFGMGMLEMVVIAVVAVVLFGGRLPEVARNFGKTYAQFRKQLNDIQQTITTDIDLDVKTPGSLPDYSDVHYQDDRIESDFDAPPEDDE